MRDQEAQLVLDASAAGVVVINEGHQVVSANAAVLDLVGKSRDDVVGRSCFEVFKGHDQVCADCPLDQALETGEAQATVYTLRTKDGRTVTLAGEITPIYDAVGGKTHVAQILRNAYPERETGERRRQQEQDLRRARVKFASKKARGWIDVGGSRMCLLDLEGGWRGLYSTLAEYAGEETAGRTLFEAGLAESFTRNAYKKGLIERNAVGFQDSVDCYSEAGFGDFWIEELHFSEGAAVIACKDTSESFGVKLSGARLPHPICYYSAGVLLSFLRFTSGKKTLCCVETSCVACGDDVCRFHLGTAAWLRKRGVRIPPPGVTMKEQVELTREWVGRIMDAAGARQLVGESDAMREVFGLIEAIKDSNSPVLLEGESGTGKQLVAEAIHKRGLRSSQPFVSVNCAAIPESLLESELFGYAKGAFTGATGDKAGLVEIASNGTLFIDEVCEMGPSAQVKLLNVLDTGVYRRIGETKERRGQMRVIAATNRDIREEVAQKRFREDLYYRLNVVNIRIAPLRERKEDIPLLVEHLLRHTPVAAGRQKTASAEFIRVLMTYDWPGNVRELANVVERATILSREEMRLTPRHLPIELVQKAKSPQRHPGEGQSLERAEADCIRKVLKQEGGNKSRTAAVLGITRATLRRKLARLGLA